jgi:hypothetical protein
VLPKPLGWLFRHLPSYLYVYAHKFRRGTRLLMTFPPRIKARAFKGTFTAMPFLFASLTLPFRVLPSLLGVGARDSGATLALAWAQE